MARDAPDDVSAVVAAMVSATDGAVVTADDADDTEDADEIEAAMSEAIIGLDAEETTLNILADKAPSSETVEETKSSTSETEETDEVADLDARDKRDGLADDLADDGSADDTDLVLAFGGSI